MRQPISRRAALGLVGSAASLVAVPAMAGSPQCRSVPPAPQRPAIPHGPSLGDLARSKGLQFGVQGSIASQHDYGEGIYDPAYLQLILAEKPDFLAFGQQFIFGNVASDPPDGDRLRTTNATYGIADTWYLANDLSPRLRAAGIGLRADALIWDSEEVRQPWLRPLAAGSSPDRRVNRDLDWNLARAEDYLRLAFAKMAALSVGNPGFVKIVSLVNEPLDPWALPGRMAYRGGAFVPPGLAQAAGAGVPAYIRDLYRLAGTLRGDGAARPKLIINEAGTEADQGGAAMRQGLLRLLKAMQAEGLPLDGVGLECHLQPQMMTDPAKPDWEPFGRFLDDIAALGLEIHLTELDVFDFAASCNGRPATPAASDALVAQYYETFLNRALACRAVKSVCVWDLSDRYAFYRSFDVDTWFGYDRLAKGKPPAAWGRGDRLPAT